MPVIAIIIPVYNAESYLRRCLDSIRLQTIIDFECLIVDDGSTDASLEICKYYCSKDDRFRLFKQENKGPSAARNLGLDNVTAEWVTFVDADDYVYDSYLENFLNNNIANKNIQIVQGYNCEGFNGLDDDTLYPSTLYKYWEVSKNRGGKYLDQKNLLYNWAVWCKVFSTQILKEHNIRFDENLRCGEDGLFWHSYLCYIDKIIYIPQVGYIYYCPRLGISSSRGGGQNMNVKAYLSLASKYKKIYKILIPKFNLYPSSIKLLRMMYLNNYFRAMRKVDIVENWEEEFEQIKPNISDFGLSVRDAIYFCLNLLPLKFAKYLLR